MTFEIVTIGDCRLFRGDALEILPTLEPGSVDLLCSDAPYKVTQGGAAQRERIDAGAGRKRSRGGWMNEYANNGDIVTCNIEWADWMPMAFDVLANDRQAYFMSNGRSLFDAHSAAVHAGDRYGPDGRLISEDGFKLHTVLVWDKRSALPNRWYQNITEFTLFMRKGEAFTINDPGSKNIFSLFQRDESKHPTEKPVELMAQYIGNSTQRGQTALDPFMGSGTTGVAAARLRRKFIGIELEKQWFDVACARIEKAYDAAYLFDEPLPMPPETQGSLWGGAA